MKLVTFSISRSVRPVVITLAPAAPNAMAIALPMPLDDHVTSAVFPSSDVMG
tara:strand:- start:34 stop:189 length:156 start_codon:yes stop_codon:yes gene_type:complete